jgi:hypothetical protein
MKKLSQTLPILLLLFSVFSVCSHGQTLAGSLTVQRTVTLTGDITPPTLSANVDNYAPAGHADASTFKISSNANRNITGLVGGTDGREKRLLNVGAYNIVLKNEDSSSTAANRFAVGGDITIPPSLGVILQYDGTVSRWRMVGNSSGVALAASVVPFTPSGTLGSITVQAAIEEAATESAAAIAALSSVYQPLSAALTATTAGFTTAQETKLAGIATGATANSTDANLRDRTTHTGAQAISTVTGLQASLDSKEIPADAQTKANNAQAAAIAAAAIDATTKADAAQATAISTAAADATTKANAAQAAAVSTAASDATTKANAAQAAAIAAAAIDATTKANAAQAAAISTASTDATTKANAAQSTAISTAASDATTKANAAQAAAIAASVPNQSRTALLSDDLTLSKSNVVHFGTVSGTKTLTLASAGNTSDWIDLDFTVTGTQTIATNFAVYRNNAGSSAVVNEPFTDAARIRIRNLGSGVYRWEDNKFVGKDLPIEFVPDIYIPTTTNLAGHLEGIDDYFSYVANWIQSNGGNSSEGMGPGTYFGWATDDLANKPADALLADGNNGTKNEGTSTSGNMTWLVMGNGTVESPTPNPAEGTYDSAQNVSATSGTAGAAIYYTSAAAPSTPADPTTASTLYTTPVNITDDTNFKFKAFKSLWAASGIVSVSYVIDVVTNLFSYGYEDNAKPSTPAAQTGGLTIDATSKLDGVYSLRGINNSSIDTITLASTYNELWVYFQHRAAAISSSPYVVRFRNGSGGNLFALRVLSTGRIRLYQADNTTTIDIGGTGVFSADTPSGVWIRFEYVTAGTSELEVYVNKTNPKIKPASPSATYYSLTAAGPVGRIELTPGTTVTSHWDLVTASTSIIGDIP